MKHETIWKERLFGIGRWVLLGLFVVCAGWLYSCSGPENQPEPVMAAAETGFSESGSSEPGFSESGQETGAWEENPDAESEPDSAAVCYVYVCGQVHQPGVYVLEEGQRIFEAVEMAGGFTEEAAEGYLNLAAPVTDGMKLLVPDESQAAEGIQALGDGESGKINLNTAAREELMTLPGIGQSRAEDIIRYREAHGGFARIEDIMKVSGIKEAAFEKIKDQIGV